jgi:hypothetical protein
MKTEVINNVEMVEKFYRQVGKIKSEELWVRKT